MSKTEFDTVKKLFTEIKDSREVSIQLFTSLDIKINKLNEIHTKLVKDNKDINFIMGLDSFNFQKILLRKEYENLNVLFKMILNRIYCDYFKLSKIIKTYVNSDIEDVNIKDAVRSYSQYPIYDTLKIHKEYDFDTVSLLYHDLVNTLIVIEDFCSNEENRLEYYINQQNAGLNINSFVLSFKSNLVDIRNKNKLFKDCIEFFVSLHNNYFKKFLTSLRILHSRVKHDIRFDESTLNSKKSTSLILNELTNEIDSSSFIDEITRQISDDTSDEGITPKENIKSTPENVTSNIEKIINECRIETEILENSIKPDNKTARLSRLPSLPFVSNTPSPNKGFLENMQSINKIEEEIDNVSEGLVDAVKDANDGIEKAKENLEELSKISEMITLQIGEKSENDVQDNKEQVSEKKIDEEKVDEKEE